VVLRNLPSTAVPSPIVSESYVIVFAIPVKYSNMDLDLAAFETTHFIQIIKINSTITNYAVNNNFENGEIIINNCGSK
jgi:hypothetical protein